MKLILARHGDTFGPGDKVVWLGQKEDRPLVARGKEQAKTLATALKSNHLKPAVIMCGPLRRAREYAQIIGETFNLVPQIDPRLDELDYGKWAGLSTEEVMERFGSDEQALWNAQSRWPTQAGFGSSEAKVKAEVGDLFREISKRFSGDHTVLLVSSNGRLRYFLAQIPSEFERRIESQDFKLKTGHIGLINENSGKPILNFWNEPPSRLGDIP